MRCEEHDRNPNFKVTENHPSFTHKHTPHQRHLVSSGNAATHSAIPKLISHIYVICILHTYSTVLHPYIEQDRGTHTETWRFHWNAWVACPCLHCNLQKGTLGQCTLGHKQHEWGRSCKTNSRFSIFTTPRADGLSNMCTSFGKYSNRRNFKKQCLL